MACLPGPSLLAAAVSASSTILPMAPGAMGAAQAPVQLWHPRVLPRPRVSRPCGAVPARAVVAKTSELLIPSLVWLCWLRRAGQCSRHPAPPEAGVVTKGGAELGKPQGRSEAAAVCWFSPRERPALWVGRDPRQGMHSHLIPLQLLTMAQPKGFAFSGCAVR